MSQSDHTRVFPVPSAFIYPLTQITTTPSIKTPKNAAMVLETLRDVLGVVKETHMFKKITFSHPERATETAKFTNFSALSALARMPKPWTFAMIPGGSTNGAGSNGNSTGIPVSSSSSLPSNTRFSLFSLIPCNPSLGLFLFAPIVPAADNRPALALLTSVQLLMGLSLMTRRVPKIGESRFRLRASAAARFLAGSVLVFLSGIEALRVAIPYDPWADQAREWRRWAVKHGRTPSSWHGAIAFYTPMHISEWKVRITRWLQNTINSLEAEEEVENALSTLMDKDSNLLSNIPIGLRVLLKPGEENAYNDIYHSLFLKTSQRAKELLAGELHDVTELNKAARVDLILENKGDVHLNQEYLKPHIQLGNLTMESDEEFEIVWANFDPWDELSTETSYDVRFIPSWRCINGELLDELLDKLLDE